MIQHAQAYEHTSRYFTLKHAPARTCALIHRCPSLRLLTCIIGKEIFSGIVACCLRSDAAVAHICQNQGASDFCIQHNSMCRFSLCLLSSLALILEKICHFAAAQGWTNRTLAVHERVNSRFLVLPFSLSIFTPDYWAQLF